eukprot:TRINITY_DN31611_c0_g1_i1.p1 TRINITY_DN31611_c0_g1~~TRINITY_DN31611_c0_g1_i1.p1  ORF type:complete len:173 (-),score=24.33 TRINITY_DN31611_c0_g1_i1:340-858(-)
MTSESESESEARDVVRPAWELASTMRQLPPASLLEGDPTRSSEAVSEVESTSSGYFLDHMMRELARAPPGADLNSMASALWADRDRSRNQLMASSRTPTGELAELGNPLHPGISSGSHFQSADSTEASTGRTGVQQQPDAASGSSHQGGREQSTTVAIGRAVNARSMQFPPL